MLEAIKVVNLTKSFRTRVNQGKHKGIFSKIKNILSPQYKEVNAVSDISFTIKEGELVGFVGPNGAGKSTTIKMLSGILFQTNGEIQVLGLNPQENRIALTRQIGTIFGQKQQLWYHLPPIDSFELFSKIYDIDRKTYESRLKRLVSLFELEPFLNTPVRKLSLGERMRCEFVASLLHNPKILFLDEPTIGLDIIAKKTMRDFIKKLNKEEKTTIILTSHDLEDIEELCQRLMIINHGKILYDGKLSKISEMLNTKRITFYFGEKVGKVKSMAHVKIVKKEDYEMIVEIDKNKMPVKKVVEHYFSKYSIADLDIQDPPIEEVISKFYRK